MNSSGRVQTSLTGLPAAFASRAASIAEFPSLAYIEARVGKGGFACTGTVVAPRVILTAAHCIEGQESGAFTPPSAYAVATGVVGDLADLAPRFEATPAAGTAAELDPRELDGRVLDLAVRMLIEGNLEGREGR